MNKLRIATSQFPVSLDIRKNESYIRKHLIFASKNNADIIQFPETSLSGYVDDISKFDWSALNVSLNNIKILAKKYQINIVLGSIKKENDKEKPYNCTYLISRSGEILGTYLKNKLYGKEKELFNSKENFLVRKINGINCGFLICYDSCFPHLFEYYRRQNVNLLFLSYYNAGSSKENLTLNNLIKAQIITRAADNLIYISASNSSSKYSRIPSCVVSPDGNIVSLKRHRTGVLIYDYPSSSIGWTYDNRK